VQNLRLKRCGVKPGKPKAPRSHRGRGGRIQTLVAIPCRTPHFELRAEVRTTHASAPYDDPCRKSSSTFNQEHDLNLEPATVATLGGTIDIPAKEIPTLQNFEPTNQFPHRRTLRIAQQPELSLPAEGVPKLKLRAGHHTLAPAPRTTPKPRLSPPHEVCHTLNFERPTLPPSRRLRAQKLKLSSPFKE
jgi:hypothetical protein